MILREVEERFGIIEHLAKCFTEYRDPDRIEHSCTRLLAHSLCVWAMRVSMTMAAFAMIPS